MEGGGGGGGGGGLMPRCPLFDLRLCVGRVGGRGRRASPPPPSQEKNSRVIRYNILATLVVTCHV